MVPHLSVSKDGPLGIIRFVNPAKLNALTHDMWEGLGDAVNEFGADPAVRAVILTGEGRRAFTTGADISQMVDFDADEFDRVVVHAQTALDRILKPTVAVVHGYCVGGGFDIGLRCDIRFGDEKSNFGAPDPKLGTAWGTGTQKLIEAVGPARARDIIISCRLVEAEEARQIGLVSKIVSADELDDFARGEALRIASYAPLSMKAAKFTFAELLRSGSDVDVQAIKQSVRDCVVSEDFAEGQRAFLERRPPNFVGK